MPGVNNRGRGRGGGVHVTLNGRACAETGLYSVNSVNTVNAVNGKLREVDRENIGGRFLVS